MHCNNSCVVLAAGVTVAMSPTPQMVTTGETAIFTCSAENTMDAPMSLMFTWLRNGMSVTTTGRISASEVNTTISAFTSTLNITNTMRSDVGNYSCRVTNFLPDDAVTSGMAELTVRCKLTFTYSITYWLTSSLPIPF